METKTFIGYTYAIGYIHFLQLVSWCYLELSSLKQAKTTKNPTILFKHKFVYSKLYVQKHSQLNSFTQLIKKKIRFKFLLKEKVFWSYQLVSGYFLDWTYPRILLVAKLSQLLILETILFFLSELTIGTSKTMIYFNALNT